MKRKLGWLVPLIVSAILLAWLFQRFDVASGLAHVTRRSALVLIPALLAYGAISLWLEALTLAMLVPSKEPGFGVGTCARIKAATYPVALIHYALGGGTLALMIRRHAGGLADAAGVVLLISVTDLAVLLVYTAIGAAWLGSAAPALQAGVVGGSVAALAAGLVVLRAPLSLGPLDRLRELSLFRVARTIPVPALLRLGLLRVAFVATFVAMVGAALYAFDVAVPLSGVAVGAGAVALVAALPIAMAGLGTGQVAFVYVFGAWGAPDVLLACSLTLTAGILVMRGGLGLVFARELTREAFDASRELEI